jgi:hypothetical protein
MLSVTLIVVRYTAALFSIALECLPGERNNATSQLGTEAVMLELRLKSHMKTLSGSFHLFVPVLVVVVAIGIFPFLLFACGRP